MLFKRIPIDGLPKANKMYLLIGKDIQKGTFNNYTTDVYCGWQNVDGSYSRWNHDFPPTHYAEFSIEFEDD